MIPKQKVAACITRILIMVPSHHLNKKRKMMTVPIIIDFSSSGFDPESYPIEVGFSGRHGEGWCSLIRPELAWLGWDVITEKKHKIPREILVQRGNAVKFVAEQLNFYLRNQTVHSEDWGLDLMWLERIFSTAGIKPHFKLCDLFEIIQDEQLLLWDTTKTKVMKELCVDRRRASGDARVLQLTWLRTFDAMNSAAITK